MYFEVLFSVSYCYDCSLVNTKPKRDLCPEDRIDAVVLHDESVIQFGFHGTRYDDVNNEILGYTTENIHMKIAYDDVLSVKVVEGDGTKTTWLVIGMIPIVILVGLYFLGQSAPLN